MCNVLPILEPMLVGATCIIQKYYVYSFLHDGTLDRLGRMHTDMTWCDPSYWDLAVHQIYRYSTHLSRSRQFQKLSVIAYFL